MTGLGYSLISRFRGGLMGAVLGARLESQATETRGDRPLDQTWQRALSVSTTYLIQSGEFQIQTWPGLEPATTTAIAQEQILAASLPLALWLHEAPTQLEPQLQALIVAELGSLEPEVWTTSFVVSRLITQALQPAPPSAQILAAIAQPSDLTPALAQLLQQVQDCLEQQVGLAPALALLAPTPPATLSQAVALALYCWLRTPTHPYLSLAQALQTRVPFTPLLTGALAGATNGWSGFPWFWRWQLAATSWQQTADHLLAVWGGWALPLPEDVDPTSIASLAIAAPGLLRPR